MRNPVFNCERAHAETVMHMAIARFKADPQSKMMQAAYIEAYLAFHGPNDIPPVRALRRAAVGVQATLYQARARHPDPSELPEIPLAV